MTINLPQSVQSKLYPLINQSIDYYKQQREVLESIIKLNNCKLDYEYLKFASYDELKGQSDPFSENINDINLFSLNTLKEHIPFHNIREYGENYFPLQKQLKKAFDYDFNKALLNIITNTLNKFLNEILGLGYETPFSKQLLGINKESLKNYVYLEDIYISIQYLSNNKLKEYIVKQINEWWIMEHPNESLVQYKNKMEQRADQKDTIDMFNHECEKYFIVLDELQEHSFSQITHYKNKSNAIVIPFDYDSPMEKVSPFEVACAFLIYAKDSYYELNLELENPNMYMEDNKMNLEPYSKEF
ncbi:hypothetical protein DY052_06405, partial [Apilactobacillus timberlakei]|uniref:hypothetical protein n=1 Tax=Apilactobacillus timberlakei TaxID=2008380 RepID=UPI00112E0D42